MQDSLEARRYQTAVEALKALQHSDAFEVVLGLSGGMDSALVACMCVDAFGSEKVHAYMLPGPYSSAGSVEDAIALGKNLSLDVHSLSITPAFEAFKATLQDECGERFFGLAQENIQARCRMICLMALSNAFGWTLINTGNLSEGMMGYATLYGDMAGAFAPIGSLYKTEVYEVARWRNELAVSKGEAPFIPEAIFTKPPSAELAPDQTDAAGLGCDYPQLDAILKALFDERQSEYEAAQRTGSSRDLVASIHRRAEMAAFKRRISAPYPPRIA